MKKLTILFLILLLTNLTLAQVNSIKALDISKEIENGDFSFLSKELDGVQVLMLGEITHNDGNVFELKTKIIEYLHQEMGFNTIAFESGTYEVWKANNDINANKNIAKAFRNSLFPIWSESKEFLSFIQFYTTNKKKLKLFGFDNQFTGSYTKNSLTNDLFTYCNKHKLTLNLNQIDFELLIESIDDSNVFDEKDIEYDIFKKALNDLLSEIDKKPKHNEHFYWSLIIKNLLAYSKNCHLEESNILSTFNTNKGDNIRDIHMANNLLQYVDKNPNEKIICWGANAHFVNNMTSINYDTIKKFKPMGSYIKNKLQDKVYSLALITAEDSIYLGSKWNKTPIKENSFESYLKSKKHPFMFISSKQKAMRQKSSNRLFSPITFINAKLNEIHDGYIYLDKAIPATFVNIQESDLKLNKPNYNRIFGQVVDEKTKEPISFVNILIKGTYLGTTTNKDGFFELYSPNSLENKEIVFSTMGYTNQTFLFKSLPKKIELFEKTNNLEEVHIYGNTAAFAIIKEAINNKTKNYPIDGFNVTHYANSKIEIGDKQVLNFDIVARQYDHGYLSKWRPTQNIKQIRWNIKKMNVAKNIHMFFFPLYNSVVFSSFLNSRKYKKFEFRIEEEMTYLGNEIYVLSFKTDRNHYTYTNKSYKSDFSGLIYINIKDKAIVKTIENWLITEDFTKVNYDNNSINKYSLQEYTKMTLENNYIKNEDNLYYLNNSFYEELGKVKDKNNKLLDFKKVINSFWYDYETENVTKIKFRQEEEKFSPVKYNSSFWDSYKFPHRFLLRK